MKECIKCGRLRSTKYMQQAVFRDFVGDEPVDVWKCVSNESCKKERQLCPRCKHKKNTHKNITRFFDGRENVLACTTNMGMGNPCACEFYEEKRSRHGDVS